MIFTSCNDDSNEMFFDEKELNIIQPFKKNVLNQVTIIDSCNCNFFDVNGRNQPLYELKN